MSVPQFPPLRCRGNSGGAGDGVEGGASASLGFSFHLAALNFAPQPLGRQSVIKIRLAAI